MNNQDKTTVVNTTPFFSLLTILFIGLKLTGYIGWSWVWVLAPIWIPFAFFTTIFLVVVFVAIVRELRK